MHLRSGEHKKLGCLGCALLAAIYVDFAFAQTTLPEESTWAWIHTGPLFDKWAVVTGKAKLKVKDGALTAELFDANHPNLVSFRLSGAIKGDRITVRAVREHSGAGPTDFSGKIKTEPVKGFADFTGKQTILLYDDWNHQIGLTRTLRR